MTASGNNSRPYIRTDGLVTAFVFDIDGVLCDSDSYTKGFIQAGIEELGPPPEGVALWNHLGDYSGWKDYHPYDQPPIPGWQILLQQLYYAGYYIVILTSRTDNVIEGNDGTDINKRERTLEWLEKHHMPHDEFIMWGGNEECSYDEFKVGKIAELQERLHIVLAIDDHEGHCNAYKEAGVPFLHAHPHSIR